MAVYGMDIFDVILSSIGFFVVSVFFIRLIAKECSVRTLNIGNLCAVFAVLCFLISEVWLTTNSIYYMVSSINNSFDKEFCISRWFVASAWSFGKFAVYLFFIARLHGVFDKTVFMIPLKRLQIMAVLVCIPNAIYIVLVYYVLAVPSKLIYSTDFEINNGKDCKVFFNEYTSDGVEQYMYIGIVISLLNQIIFSIIILRLFLKRIIFLSLTLKDETKTALVEKDILNLAIKTTNLTILAFMTLFVFLFNGSGISSAVIYSVDGVISTIAISLTYKSNSKIYNKLFSCCNHCCYGCCIKLCFCCCSIKKLPENIQLSMAQKANVAETSNDHQTVSSQSSSGALTTSSAKGTVIAQIM